MSVDVGEGAVPVSVRRNPSFQAIHGDVARSLCAPNDSRSVSLITPEETVSLPVSRADDRCVDYGNVNAVALRTNSE